MAPRLVLAVSLLPFLLSTGCAALAKRPDTPAAKLNVSDLLANSNRPNERYYIMLFGSQSTPRVPAKSHTWATMVKVTDDPKGGPPSVESHTISWLPDSMKVRWWRLLVEPGSNFTLDYSLDLAERTGQRISMWGPYETWSGLYDRFVVQKEWLDSDAIGYQCTDMIGESACKGNGCDCFHAISDVDPQFGRGNYPLRYFGERATGNIVDQLHERPILIKPWETHDWLISALGIDRRPIIRRTYTGPIVEFSPEAVLAAANEGKSRRR